MPTSLNDNSSEHRDPQPVYVQSSGAHKGLYAALGLALAACVALFIYGYQTSSRLSQLNDTTQAQITKLNDQLTQSSTENSARAESLAKEAQENAATAEERARNEVRKTSASLSAKIAEQTKAAEQTQQQVAGTLDELKQANTTANSKLSEISDNVSSVKGEVSGVKGDLGTTQSQVEQTTNDLKRMTGDMGVMSGSIATNGKELAALRELGERNYVEFDLKRTGGLQKVGVLQLALAKADPKRNRFTLDVMSDDKKVEKRDRTINEPVQLYVSGAHQPCEIVVNQVKKDEIVGYVAIPKVGMSRPASQ